MGEYQKREFTIATASSRLFVDGASFGLISASTTRQFRYEYGGNKIFLPNRIFVYSRATDTAGTSTGYPALTWQLQTDNGKLLVPVNMLGFNRFANTYDNFDMVRPLTNSEGYLVTVNNLLATNRLIFFSIMGTEYLT